MKFTLLDNWKDVLLHAWSSRLILALFIINAFDASYSFFLGYAPIPQWATGLITCFLTCATLYARLVVQRKLSGDANARQ